MATATLVTDRVPSSERVVPGSINIPIASWPTTTSIDKGATDAVAISSKIIDTFNQSLGKKDYKAIADLFVDQGYWRDQLALTWDLRTAKGKEKIIALLQGGHHLVSVDVNRSEPNTIPQTADLRSDGSVRGIRFFITSTTAFGSGPGVVHLIQESGQWKIWTFFTTVDKLKDHPEAIGPNRSNGVQHGARTGRKNWLDRRRAEVNFENSEPDVLIVGSGQAGLSVGSRLKMLNVPTLIIDRTDEIGDAWRNRYHQLVIHDPVWYDHMPYIRFPEFWPVFTPKDKMADFLKSYAHMLELNVWTKTELESSVWDEQKKQWQVVLKRKNVDGSTETRTFHPKHIIQSTGHSGKKNYPDFKGTQNFKGDTLCHSSDFRGAKTDANGRKAVVIGSCNSALDIAQDYYENGYDITIIQRSSTCVMSSNAVLRLLLGPLYYEGGPPVELCDLLDWSAPREVSKALHADINTQQQVDDRELLDGLNKAGFKTDRGPMNCGLFYKYIQRGGGYYIDVGTAQLIVDGKVKVKHGQGIDEILPNGVRLDDGTVLEADEIVCATGYQNMRTATEAIFGTDVASKVGEVWGLDAEGETRIMWRQSGHPGLWLHGGNLAMCRYFSRVVALQIKARLEGLTS
ncbi:putative flavin-binding monooxygenase-like protein [Rosellinia necatrix]|uniref:Putative flavin-binding monooxygenase-like protein n=1 Tax=Rosellinia necatrix TaxID=77044 RepID=A0A1W2TTQ0_ROSNE|nr:putative flavin-binding monooxygenase-like protein [Rosellinia necatrix]